MLLEIEPQRIDGGDVAVRVHGEQAAGIVEQLVGEGAAVGVDADDGAGKGAVAPYSLTARLPLTPVGASLTFATVTDTACCAVPPWPSEIRIVKASEPVKFGTGV